jgi:hypothetical protein
MPGILSEGSTTPMSTAWSPAAASPTTAAIGILHATATWFLSRPWPSSCAASSERRSQSAGRTSLCRTLHGESRGSSIAPPGAKMMRPCSAISPATCSALRSPTTALSVSTTTALPFATNSASREMAEHPPERPRVHAPIPPARSAQRSAQGPLLLPLAPGATRACSTSPSHALARPPDAESNDVIC